MKYLILTDYHVFYGKNGYSIKEGKAIDINNCFDSYQEASDAAYWITDHKFKIVDTSEATRRIKMPTEMKINDFFSIMKELIPPSSADLEILEKFKKEMEDKVIPEIIKTIDERCEAAIERRKRILKTPPPVDRTAQTLTDGSPVTPEHREINPLTGQQRGYVILSEYERSKGFVRPVRQVYIHLKCDTETRMDLAIAETYARDPQFYTGTFCCHCKSHYPLDEFKWKDSGEKLGS